MFLKRYDHNIYHHLRSTGLLSSRQADAVVMFKAWTCYPVFHAVFVSVDSPPHVFAFVCLGVKALNKTSGSKLERCLLSLDLHYSAPQPDCAASPRKQRLTYLDVFTAASLNLTRRSSRSSLSVLQTKQIWTFNHKTFPWPPTTFPWRWCLCLCHQ